jgi:hypothetical protein
MAGHGLVYGLGDGLLRDLQVSMTNVAEIVPVYQSALALARERVPGHIRARRP